MNTKKNIDYSELFARLDAVLTANLPQTETNCEVGRLIAKRPEKGRCGGCRGILAADIP